MSGFSNAEDPVEALKRAKVNVSATGLSDLVRSGPSREDKKVVNSVLDCIGNTPMIRLNKIRRKEGIKCELFAKCEFFNAGGSVKDRIALRMIEEAEASGRIKPGDTIIEPTSGNTGIGLALCGAIKGYRVIITLPEKMSKEKVDVLKALGAEIIRTPTEAAWDSPDSHIGVARRLEKELENAHILDQYVNSANPMAHYHGTAEEIWTQMEGKVDYLIAGAGTGGTISGTAKRLKELNPDIQVIGVDPAGSILAEPASLNETDITGYQVEGIGYDFIPDVCNRQIVDRWMKSYDKDSFLMARRLIRDEGLLCGGSSGTAAWAAVQVAKTLPADKRVVVILPDSVRNYMTKFLSEPWMYEGGFMDESMERKAAEVWWSNNRVGDLELESPVTVGPDVSVRESIHLMNSNGFDMLPVQSKEDGKVLGVITSGQLTAKLTSGDVRGEDHCIKAMYKKFSQVTLSTTLSDLATLLDRDSFALVTAEQRNYDKGEIATRAVVAGVVTRIDLLSYIAKNEDKQN